MYIGGNDGSGPLEKIENMIFGIVSPSIGSFFQVSARSVKFSMSK